MSTTMTPPSLESLGQRSACNRCGTVWADVRNWDPVRKAGTTNVTVWSPALCGGCGHIFVPIAGGKGRELTADEKARIRRDNAAAGNDGRARQDKVTERMWG